MAKRFFKNNQNFFRQNNSVFCVDDAAPGRMADLNPASIENAIYTNNASVPIFHDTQGNYDATQGTVASQPIYLTNVINSKPIMRFNSKKMSWGIGSVLNKDMILVFRHNSGFATVNQGFFEANPKIEGSYSGLGGRNSSNIFSSTVNGFSSNTSHRLFVGTDLNNNQLTLPKSSSFRIITLRFNSIDYNISGIGKLTSSDTEMDVDFARIIVFSRRLTYQELLNEINQLKTEYAL